MGYINLTNGTKNLPTNKKYFFDANIYIYLYFPPPGQSFPNYSDLLEELIKPGYDIVTNINVLSEVINRAHRFKYNLYLKSRSLKRKDFTYKNYRECEDGKDSMSPILLRVRTILDYTNLISSSYTSSDIKDRIDGLEVDFNDLIIAEDCKRESLILVTNDYDFSMIEGLEIATKNNNYFKK